MSAKTVPTVVFVRLFAIHAHERDHRPSMDRVRLKGVRAASMPTNDRPSTGHADAGPEHHVAQKIAAFAEPPRRPTSRAPPRPPRAPVSTRAFPCRAAAR